ncbi:MAG: hypothetical protein K2G93_02125 [Rikenella sp.]|nr:hypothetical protein [Rikenella sp.]
MRTIAFILLGAAIAALLLLKCCSGPSVVVREVVRADTVTVVRVDTVIVEKPVPVRVVEQEPVYIQVPVPGDTVFEPGDTVRVPVPISQYQFRDSLYALDVSGYAVSVDRIEVYPRTIYRTINQTTERIITDKKRWGLGIQAGYGYNFGSGKLSPYVGVGVQYSVIRF